MKKLRYGKRALSTVVVLALLLTSVFIMPVYAEGEDEVTVFGAVTYDANGGKGTATRTGVEEGSALNPPAVTRTGYTLTGWYTEKSGGSRVTTVAFVPGTEAVTYYAQWQGKKVKVTYNVAKGKLAKKAKKSKQVTVGGKYGSLPKATRSGHKFLGWYSGSAKVTAATVVAKSGAHKLTAKWLKKGSGKTITAAEYGRLKVGLSKADAKYTVGGVGASENIYGFTVYVWQSQGSSTKGAMAFFADGKLVWKGKGTSNSMLNKFEKWLYGPGKKYL
jgi:uncharacterized repeat protein (TIGR02543 family)